MARPNAPNDPQIRAKFSEEGVSASAAIFPLPGNKLYNWTLYVAELIPFLCRESLKFPSNFPNLFLFQEKEDTHTCRTNGYDISMPENFIIKELDTN